MGVYYMVSAIVAWLLFKFWDKQFHRLEYESALVEHERFVLDRKPISKRAVYVLSRSKLYLQSNSGYLNDKDLGKESGKKGCGCGH